MGESASAVGGGVTARDGIVRGATALATISDTPRLDAELLMAHALGLSREAMLLGRLDDLAPESFAGLLRRRLDGEPIAYITGRRAFWTIELAVAPGVLIPRPDTETLIEAAIDHFGARAPASILDLGTGSGALLLAALDIWPDAHGLGIDRSPEALVIARGNAERLGLAERARFQAGDWGEGIADRFDLVLCNPPYVESEAVLPREVAEHEPASALFAGPEGLDEYRRLAPQIGQMLAPGGVACIEIGFAQGAAVSALFRDAGFDPSIRQDLGGRDRCVILGGSS
ncbi:peptide chain release factor N(5)-glutamine methyltransferase [Flavisphingomonas formosensis]|uniref:peptide chain release factor N(5)-glutamine methyltransferase n=1 Tax=Flavisphingomonas formosensis TaxID=861534 RepID=UPI0012F8A3F6|nr:peptide chain release factor N(5)-glutamine methyltransferase [Sphingomonas formosensis]